MKRRNFLKVAAGGGAAAATLAAPAIAQSNPKLQWRLTSGFPRSLDTIFGAAEVFAEHVKAMTDGNFEIQVFPAGEIVPTPQAAEAVGTDTVEMAHTCSYYYWGKDPTFAIGTAVPFGLNARLMNSWLYEGGGNDLLNAFYAKHNLYGLPAGNTGVQMGGWWRKEINSPRRHAGRQDAHRRHRRPGRGEARRGAAADPRRRHLPGARARHHRRRRVGRALRRREARLLQGGALLLLSRLLGGRPGDPLLRQPARSGTSCRRPTRRSITNAAAYANTDMQAKYDARNPGALRSLIAGGAKLKPFPADVIDAAYAAAHEVYDEISAENADFKAIFDNVKAFRNEGYLWWQVAEYTYDTFMIRNRTKG